MLNPVTIKTSRTVSSIVPTTNKKLLRKNVKNRLKIISQRELIKQSDVILNKLKPILLEQQTQKGASLGIGCYMNMDASEVKTLNIINFLFENGFTVYLPKCTSTKESGQINLRTPQLDIHHPHLTFHQMVSFQHVLDLKPSGKFKLKEPSDESAGAHPPNDIDVLLVPGVAFNLHNMARLGHGCGYYDDYIYRHAHYNNKRPLLLIGLALKEQIIEQDIPLEEHDRKLDCIIVGDGTVNWK
ncbi:related to 5-formyltetrahydrofolate cyclo-ligase [Saccharomycodes ludwigii]|uniref:5-formyltetrahydrofolate cyclo-ligase n=1 Tax=Saccharomycodes ludwigii TaxID=36035 RepID=A0A376BBS7_9ASCO|nr:hypothetical protein SCDLUD_004401 [Saccharomycodes ludwigii]KAH3900081.1 hypothetical protein SCDLUD_004401 [Saccharomycodes ludwigii]SSD62145.1 related to 5-formyltetrahydrofolate cyclo-ligase [Saccharomycodes ludwigii]